MLDTDCECGLPVRLGPELDCEGPAGAIGGRRAEDGAEPELEYEYECA